MSSRHQMTSKCSGSYKDRPTVRRTPAFPNSGVNSRNFPDISANGFPAPDSSKSVLVTFGQSKRILSFNSGFKLRDLRYDFLRSFSDMLSEHFTVANLQFQQYDDIFQEYVDIDNDVILDDNVKLKVYIKNHDHLKHSKSTQATSAFDKPHQIKQNVTYKLWNPVKNGVIMFDPSPPGSVLTSGRLDETNSENTVETKFVGLNRQSTGQLFNLVYNGSPTQHITATATGTGVSLTTNPTENAEFQPIYYYSFTMFRCNSRSSKKAGMYLGCSESGNSAVLVPVIEEYEIPGYYPDPRTLFITTESAI
ncbi:uncharacterized protein [Montipora capricornis]|uniref:uncharacterized protein n=1 Tax=Montipora capricornis TaxID=246305 RepID=UPI0035F1AB1F